METALLVANPAASAFTGGAHRDVARILSDRYDVRPVWPQSADHATALTLEAVQAGITAVVAMGGDGIVHRVAQSVVDSPTVLGIIPAGTTNVLARLLGIPTDPADAARLVAGENRVAGEPVVEAVLTRRGGDPVRVQGLFSVGAGFDARVVEAAESEPYRKYRFGGIHYARTAIGLARTQLGGPREVAVASGGRTRQVEGVLVQFQRAYTYFGRVPLRLSPRPPDPMIAALIEGLRVGQAPALVRAAAFGGDLGRIAGLHVWHGCQELTVEAPSGVAVQIDGEPLGEVVAMTLRHRPEALRCLVPPLRRGAA